MRHCPRNSRPEGIVLIAAFICMAALSVSLQAQHNNPSIAVVPLRNSSGITQSEAELISDRLGVELFHTGQVSVMERSQMQEVLKEQGFQSSGACTDEACLVEMGQLLGVQFIVTGSIGKLGSMYMINLRLIDISTGRITQVVSEDVPGRIEEVVGRLRGIARSLMSVGEKKEEPAASRRTRTETPDRKEEYQAREKEAVSTMETLPDGDCPADKIEFYGSCTSKRKIATAGNMVQLFTTIPYAAGTIYNSIANIAWSIGGKREYSSSYGSTYYDYYRVEALVAIIPQTAGTTLFGGLNQAARYKQRRYLRELGSPVNRRRTTVGWIFYGLTVVSGTMNIIAMGADATSFGPVISIINSTLIIPSYIINTTAYYKNKKQLREATTGKTALETGTAPPRSHVQLAPYMIPNRDGGQAGLLMSF